MENIGIMIGIAMPPYCYSFGVSPLHWKYVKHIGSTTCADCGAETKSIHLRIGPLSFAVTQAGHGHP